MRKSTILLLLVSVIVLTSFAKKKKSVPKVKDPEGYVFIPMRSEIIENKTVSVMAFYISAHEVSNKQYNEFLNHLKRNGEVEKYKKALYDSTLWRQKTSYLEPFVDYYHSHPAYANYPVVNISHEAAEIYCDYLTEKYQHEFNEKGFTVKFRLPHKIEWIVAARGGLDFSPYPWGGPYLRNNKGCYMCNFKNIGAENIHYNDSTNTYEILFSGDGIATNFNDNAQVTAPVTSYFPNNYGLYNCSGNVAEMVAEKGYAYGGHWNSTGYDVRIESNIKLDKASPFVGFRPVMSFAPLEK